MAPDLSEKGQSAVKALFAWNPFDLGLKIFIVPRSEECVKLSQQGVLCPQHDVNGSYKGVKWSPEDVKWSQKAIK